MLIHLIYECFTLNGSSNISSFTRYTVTTIIVGSHIVHMPMIRVFDEGSPLILIIIWCLHNLSHLQLNAVAAVAAEQPRCDPVIDWNRFPCDTLLYVFKSNLSQLITSCSPPYQKKNKKINTKGQTYDFKWASKLWFIFTPSPQQLESSAAFVYLYCYNLVHYGQ